MAWRSSPSSQILSQRPFESVESQQGLRTGRAEVIAHPRRQKDTPRTCVQESSEHLFPVPRPEPPGRPGIPSQVPWAKGSGYTRSAPSPDLHAASTTYEAWSESALRDSPKANGTRRCWEHLGRNPLPPRLQLGERVPFENGHLRGLAVSRGGRGKRKPRRLGRPQTQYTSTRTHVHTHIHLLTQACTRAWSTSNTVRRDTSPAQPRFSLRRARRPRDGSAHALPLPSPSRAGGSSPAGRPHCSALE